MAGIDLVIFDNDGVVVDSELLANRVLSDAVLPGVSRRDVHHDGRSRPAAQFLWRAAAMRPDAAACRRIHDGGWPDSAAMSCQVHPAARRSAR